MEQERNRRLHNDEIDLVELITGLWAGRWLIISITCAVTALAAFYVFWATPYYQVTSVLNPPALKELDELNGTGVYKLSPGQALARVGAAVSSYDNRLAFAQANEERLSFLKGTNGSFEQGFDRFSAEAFEVKQPDPKKDSALSPFISLSLTYPEGMDGASFTNDFIQFAIAQERQKLKDDFDAVVANRLAVQERKIIAHRASYSAEKEHRIAALLEKDMLKTAQLEDELAALRQLLLARRKSRISVLDENITIARTLDIQNPTTPALLGEPERAPQGNVIRTEVNNQVIPLYFMGTAALEAERNALLKRRSDDFTEPRIAEVQKELRLLKSNRQVEVLNRRQNEDLFLNKLSESREEKARLEELEVNFTSLELVKIDRFASQPVKPIKPKKLLILTIGVVLGGMLGVMLALLLSVLRKKEQDSAPEGESASGNNSVKKLHAIREAPALAH